MKRKLIKSQQDFIDFINYLENEYSKWPVTWIAQHSPKQYPCIIVYYVEEIQDYGWRIDCEFLYRNDFDE